MIVHLLRDALASEEPEALDLEGGLLAEDGHHGEGVVAELVVHALQESVHQVGGLVEQHAFALVLLIVHEVKRVTLGVVILEEMRHPLGCLLVAQVHEVGLELRQDELRGRKQVEWVLPGGLLLHLLVLFLSGLRLLGGGHGGSLYLLLFLLCKQRLERLRAELHVADAGDHFGELDVGLNPGGHVGDGLSVAAIERALEQKDHIGRHVYVGNSEAVADQVSLALQVLVDIAKDVLDLFDGVVESVRVQAVHAVPKTPSIDGEEVWLQLGVGEVNPLVNQSCFKRGCTSQVVLPDGGEVTSDRSTLYQGGAVWKL